MSELANYSIETDHTVLLAYADGRRLRVPIGQLPHHLAKPDLERVRASLRLRRDFIRTHMPKAALLLLGIGLVSLLSVGGKAVADMFNVPQPNPIPPKSEIVRSQFEPEGHVETAPTPSIGASSAMLANAPKPDNKDKSKTKSKPDTNTKKATATLKPSAFPKPAVVPSVSPIPTPSPSVEPSPATTPEPEPKNQGGGANDAEGDVAGDCDKTVDDPTFICP
ncbi:MAG: hypothetical protein K0S68_418 [Candidatus Saccharibacteria bacterium]|jgi:hypothetical protein|nr:hypothetical protein [Candidatus Saccharibacteria bacterium]